MCGGFYDIIVIFDFEVFWGVYSLYVTPLRLFVVPEVLLSQEIPSEEVRMVPSQPTVTKSPFPYVILPLSSFDVPESLKVHVTPSEEVRVVVDFSVVVVLVVVELSEDELSVDVVVVVVDVDTV